MEQNSRRKSRKGWEDRGQKFRKQEDKEEGSRWVSTGNGIMNCQVRNWWRKFWNSSFSVMLSWDTGRIYRFSQFVLALGSTLFDHGHIISLRLNGIHLMNVALYTPSLSSTPKAYFYIHFLLMVMSYPDVSFHSQFNWRNCHKNYREDEHNFKILGPQTRPKSHYFFPLFNLNEKIFWHFSELLSFKKKLIWEIFFHSLNIGRVPFLFLILLAARTHTQKKTFHFPLQPPTWYLLCFGKPHRSLPQQGCLIKEYRERGSASPPKGTNRAATQPIPGVCKGNGFNPALHKAALT